MDATYIVMCLCTKQPSVLHTTAGCRVVLSRREAGIILLGNFHAGKLARMEKNMKRMTWKSSRYKSLIYSSTQGWRSLRPVLVLRLPHNARVFVWCSSPRLQHTLEKNRKKNQGKQVSVFKYCDDCAETLDTVYCERASLTSEVQLYAEHNLWAFRQMWRINTWPVTTTAVMINVNDVNSWAVYMLVFKRHFSLHSAFQIFLPVFLQRFFFLNTMFQSIKTCWQL